MAGGALGMPEGETWRCCVGSEKCLCFPCVDVILRANSLQIEDSGMWQCCFLGESPSSSEVVTSSLPD